MDKLVAVDYLIARLARAEFAHTELDRAIQEAYRPDSLGQIYEAIDERGLTDEFARMVAEIVVPTDSLVVIEGAISAAQQEALRRELEGVAYVWTADRGAG
jgi:hypothetical protein